MTILILDGASDPVLVEALRKAEVERRAAMPFFKRVLVRLLLGRP